MRFFLDTEFIESGPYAPIQLISLGMVSEDGRTYYAISSEFSKADASLWVMKNVLAHLEPASVVPRRTLREIAHEVIAFVWPNWTRLKPEIWGYYSDYDWVAFCQIFGSMVDLPDGFPMYCRDIKQWCDDLGNPELPKQDSTEHNALNDALWNKQAWEFLASLGQQK
jgi:hypothetical protein